MLIIFILSCAKLTRAKLYQLCLYVWSPSAKYYFIIGLTVFYASVRKISIEGFQKNITLYCYADAYARYLRNIC